MNKFIDTHSHYNHSKFKNDRKKILEALNKDLLAIINIGTNTKSNLETLQLLSLYDYIWGIIGFFPTDTWMLESDLCKESEDNWLILTKQILNQKVLGIGEIGLDYHWDSIGPKNNLIKGERARTIQKKWFRKQIELALELNLPISIHSRDSKEDTLNIIKDYKGLTGVVHCFSYDRKTAEFFVNNGFYLGIGGTSTYPRNEELRNVIKETPLKNIVLETDAPYLSPQLVRNNRNQSDYIKYVIELIAELKGIDEDAIVSITNNNVKELFKTNFDCKNHKVIN